MESLDENIDNEKLLEFSRSEKDLDQSPIRKFYKGKTIFLTGATGFLGQLLLEKLLRCGVKQVYLLVRPKKEKSPKERLKKLFEQVVFSKVREHDPNFLQRMHPIVGDLSKLNVGINGNDLQLLIDNVEVIIHSGAEVRFNEKLCDLILTNLRGTRELLKIAEKMKRLEIFTYVSTAYSNCTYGHNIREDFYTPPINPHVAIAFAENSSAEDRQDFEYITDRIIGIWPNTYTFSKSLSEDLVRQYGENFPICVIRPSIVVSTFKEPIAGWFSNIFGLTGLLSGYGTGVIRITCAKLDYNLNIVCADFTINGILVATWSAQKEFKINKWAALAPNPSNLLKPKIYAIVSSSTNITMRLIKHCMETNYQTHPPNKVAWCLCSNQTSHPLLFYYLSIYYHLLGSIFLDIGLSFTKQKFRILPISRKIQVFLKALSYFEKNEWHFENSNMRKVWDEMNQMDKKLFFCDNRNFDFKKWCPTYLQGMIRFIVNENDTKTTKKALIKHKRLRVAHFFVRMAFYLSQAVNVYLLTKAFGLVDYLKTTTTYNLEFLTNPNNFTL